MASAAPLSSPLVVLRVKRRRTEDPVEAFQVQSKRSRGPDGDSSGPASCHFRLLDTLEATATADAEAKIKEVLREKEAMAAMEDANKRQISNGARAKTAGARVKEKAKGDLLKKRSEKRFELVEALRSAGATGGKPETPTETPTSDIRILDFQEVKKAEKNILLPPPKKEQVVAKEEEGEEQISMNGQKMERIKVEADLNDSSNSDFVYDLYYRPGAIGAGGTSGANDAALKEIVDEINGELMLIPDVDYLDYYNPASDAFRLRTAASDRDFDDDDGNLSDDSNAEGNVANDYPDEDDDDDDYQYDGQEYVDFSLDGLTLGDEVASSASSSDDDDGAAALENDLVYTRTAELHGPAYAKYKKQMLKELGEAPEKEEKSDDDDDEDEEEDYDIDDLDEYY